jgi:hypothetical protein
MHSLYLFICYLTDFLLLSEYAQKGKLNIFQKHIHEKYMYLFIFIIYTNFRALQGENNGEEETVAVISINSRKRTDDGARGRAWLPRAGGYRRRGGWGLLAQGLARLARLGQGARVARRAGSRGAAARRPGAGVRAQERAERGERSDEGERVGEREERRESEQGGGGGWEKSQGARVVLSARVWGLGPKWAGWCRI